jgi:nucleotidyltransferase substrate binding protein (TIGR01987 family)
MEKIIDRYEIALQTLKTLRESLDLLETTNILDKSYLAICDSVIQRFEYSIDTFWKFIKLYLSAIVKMNIEANSPKAIIREALDAKIIDSNEFQSIIRAITRRNESSHAYNKDLARDIVEEIPLYYETLHTILNRLSIKE